MIAGTLIGEFRRALVPVMGEQEADAVTFRVMEEVLSFRRIDAVMRRNETVSPEQSDRLMLILKRLQSGEPVQYVLGKAPFLGRDFLVNKEVLIPRPETEELVLWLLEDTGADSVGRMLEAGTGTGCISISFLLERPQWDVHAFDISEEALAVARKNAERLKASLSFHAADLFDPVAVSTISTEPWDILVSNPPYIPRAEAAQLPAVVREHEPHLALFEPDEAPLKYYLALGKLASERLRPGGALYVEVHENHAAATAEVFLRSGLSAVTVKKDIFEKSRMVRAFKPAL